MTLAEIVRAWQGKRVMAGRERWASAIVAVTVIGVVVVCAAVVCGWLADMDRDHAEAGCAIYEEGR